MNFFPGDFVETGGFEKWLIIFRIEGVEGKGGEDGEKGIAYIEWKYIKH